MDASKYQEVEIDYEVKRLTFNFYKVLVLYARKTDGQLTTSSDTKYGG